MTIAGHDFGIEGKCSCGKTFADIAGARREHLSKEGWAHRNGLTETELMEIQTEVARIWSLVMGVATGSGPVAAPAPEDDEAAWLAAEVG